MKHPLTINKAGKLSKRPAAHKINFIVDGYVIGSVEFDDLVPGKTVQITPTGTLTLGSDFEIVDESRKISLQGRGYLGGSI